MGFKRGGNQLRDALLAAGIEPGSARDRGSGAKTHVSKPDAESVSGKPSPQLAPGDLPASWSQGHTTAETSRTIVRGATLRQRGAVASKAEKARPALGNSRQSLTHGPSQFAQALPAPVPPSNIPRLIRKGTFHPHPLFESDGDDGVEMCPLARIGNERQMTPAPSNAADFIIGLDFGTSTTKVVLRDCQRAVAFPVRFLEGADGIDVFLLRSSVYRSGSIYSLYSGQRRIRDLKLRLLHAGKNEVDEAFDDCCGYLALVIRRSRAWLFTAHGKEYSQHALEWKLNLGIAARSYEDEEIVLRFRRMAWVAANVAALPTADITIEDIQLIRHQSKTAIPGSESIPDVEFQASQVDVVPEISAQLQGFMRSAHWDWMNRPVMMLVDIGAGTVDVALFMVGLPTGKPPVLIFFGNRVEQNGVINLHRARVEWLEQGARVGNTEPTIRDYLEQIRMPTDSPRPIPERVQDYIPGYELEFSGTDADAEFMKERYRRQVAGCISDAKIQKRLTPRDLSQVPLLLCGGGSRMKYFAGIVDMINATPGWHVSVEKLSMPVPKELVETGVSLEEFDRLSVAFGLSLPGNDGNSIGRIVRAIDLPARSPPVRADLPDALDKDHM